MSRKFFTAMFVFLSLVCLQSITSNTVQTQQTRQTEQANSEVLPFTDLTLEISSPAQSLLPLQPIPLIIKQSNKKTKSVLGYEAVSFNQSPLSMFIRKSGTSEKIKISTLTGIAKYAGFTNVELNPGFSYQAKEWIALNLDTYAPEPGNYELQAVLPSADMKQEIESNILNIEIREPNGADRDVYNFIKNNPKSDSLFSSIEFDKGKNILETIINKFPDSAYVQSAYYTLGNVYLSRKEYQKALVNLLKLENDKDFIHAEKVKNYIAQIREAMQANQSNK